MFIVYANFRIVKRELKILSVFSDQIFQLRKEKGISQIAFAKEIGVSLRTYQDYEYGVREPQLSILCRIADFYFVSLDYLAGRSDE